jgi:5'-nucleotidase
MTKILVTNDDGVHAPGIFALAQAMRQLGEVTVVAPATNQSATGHKKTLHSDIPVAQTTLRDGSPATALTGSPTDCVALCALGLVDNWPPDIVVSGVNRGGNMGQDITYSGTVTAALEAALSGVKAVAFSLDNAEANDPADYAEAARIAVEVAKLVLLRPLPPLTILNVNIPNVQHVKGMRLVRQGVRIYYDQMIAASPEKTSYRITGPAPAGVYDTVGTDVWAVYRGYASITPIHLDMTAHHFMAELASWDITV